MAIFSSLGKQPALAMCLQQRTPIQQAHSDELVGCSMYIGPTIRSVRPMAGCSAGGPPCRVEAPPSAVAQEMDTTLGRLSMLIVRWPNGAGPGAT